MDRIECAGIDTELGQNDDGREENKTVSFAEKKKERRPFHSWTVEGVEYRMKLQASMVLKLEQKYGTNITNLIFRDDTPPLSVLLTVAQAAMAPWSHGTSIDRVNKLYDTWVDEDGGNQQDFLAKVIMPTMVVSGFFTAAQAKTILDALQEAESLS